MCSKTKTSYRSTKIRENKFYWLHSRIWSDKKIPKQLKDTETIIRKHHELKHSDTLKEQQDFSIIHHLDLCARMLVAKQNPTRKNEKNITVSISSRIHSITSSLVSWEQNIKTETEFHHHFSNQIKKNS